MSDDKSTGDGADSDGSLERLTREDGFEDMLGSCAILKKCLCKGNGKRPQVGQFVTIRTEIRALKSKKVFQEKSIVSKRVGEQNFVGGLDLAIRLMSEGENCVLRMTSRHGYGKDGSEELKVPPNTNLEIDVELLKLGSLRSSVASMSLTERLTDCKDYQAKAKKHFVKKNYSEAERLYTKALEFGYDFDTISEEHKKEKIRCMNNIALVEFNLSKFTESKAACEAVLSLDENNVKAIYRLGTIHENACEYSKSVKCLRRALEVQRTAAERDEVDNDTPTESKAKRLSSIRRMKRTLQRVRRSLAEYKESRKKFSKSMLRRRCDNVKKVDGEEPTIKGRKKRREVGSLESAITNDWKLPIAFLFCLSAFGIFWFGFQR